MKKVDSPTARGLSRAQVAEMLGVSDREVAKMDGRQLHPTRAPDRMWRYEIAEVRALVEVRGTASLAAPSEIEPAIEGKLSAAVFKLFEARKSLPKIVIATEQNPDTITALHGRYEKMRGLLVLPKAIVAEIHGMVDQAFATPRELVESLRTSLRSRFEQGLSEAHEFGQVTDPQTGKLRPVAPPKMQEVHEHAVPVAQDDPLDEKIRDESEPAQHDPGVLEGSEESSALRIVSGSHER